MKRILVVEDTEDNRQILRDLLVASGYDLVEAVDGAAGIAMAASEKPDLILMDISLPDSDGRDVCFELRTNGRAQKTRIVALTGHVDLKGSSSMSDFDGCIVKPIAMEALEALLKDNAPSPV